VMFGARLHSGVKTNFAGMIMFTQRTGAVLLAIVILACLTGCRTPSGERGLQRFEFQQPHMGTLFTLTLYASDEVVARAASDAAFARVAALDRMMSDYDPESELMQLCRKPVGQPIRVSDELLEVLEKSQRLAELTDGAFDVTVGPVVRLWRRARRSETLPPPEQLARARESVSWRKLVLNAKSKTVTLTVRDMQLDLGGIAKGYTADEALEVLKSHGVSWSPQAGTSLRATRRRVSVVGAWASVTWMPRKADSQKPFFWRMRRFPLQAIVNNLSR